MTTREPTRSTGWVPFALVALIVIPAVAGSLRLVEVFGGPHLIPANPRISASPAPVVVHIVCAVGYAVLGALQFSAALRRRRPGWHRVAGRVVVVLGLAVAFSALWMTLFYPRQPGTGELAYVFRLAFGSSMAAGIVLGFTAIRRGDVARHRAWMTRAYALALGAGTQVFTQGIGGAVFGTGELTTDLALGAGWGVNLAVAEYVIRRHRGRRRNGVAVEVGAPGPGGGHPPATGCGSRDTSTTTGPAGSVTSRWHTRATARRASPDSSRTRRSCTGCSPRSATSASP